MNQFDDRKPKFIQPSIWWGNQQHYQTQCAQQQWYTQPKNGSAQYTHTWDTSSRLCQQPNQVRQTEVQHGYRHQSALTPHYQYQKQNVGDRQGWCHSSVGDNRSYQNNRNIVREQCSGITQEQSTPKWGSAYFPKNVNSIDSKQSHYAVSTDFRNPWSDKNSGTATNVLTSSGFKRERGRLCDPNVPTSETPTKFTATKGNVLLAETDLGCRRNLTSEHCFTKTSVPTKASKCEVSKNPFSAETEKSFEKNSTLVQCVTKAGLSKEISECGWKGKNLLADTAKDSERNLTSEQFALDIGLPKKVSACERKANHLSVDTTKSSEKNLTSKHFVTNASVPSKVSESEQKGYHTLADTAKGSEKNLTSVQFVPKVHLSTKVSECKQKENLLLSDTAKSPGQTSEQTVLKSDLVGVKTPTEIVASVVENCKRLKVNKIKSLEEKQHSLASQIEVKRKHSKVSHLKKTHEKHNKMERIGKTKVQESGISSKWRKTQRHVTGSRRSKSRSKSNRFDGRSDHIQTLGKAETSHIYKTSSQHVLKTEMGNIGRIGHQCLESQDMFNKDSSCIDGVKISLCQKDNASSIRTDLKIDFSKQDLSLALLQQLFPAWKSIFQKEPVVVLKRMKNSVNEKTCKKKNSKRQRKPKASTKSSIHSPEHHKVLETGSPEKEEKSSQNAGAALPDSTTDQFVFKTFDESTAAVSEPEIKLNTKENSLLIDPRVMTLSKTLQGQLADGENAAQKVFKIKPRSMLTLSTSSASVGTQQKKVPKLDISKLKNKLKNFRFPEEKKVKSTTVDAQDSSPKALQCLRPEIDYEYDQNRILKHEKNPVLSKSNIASFNTSSAKSCSHSTPKNCSLDAWSRIALEETEKDSGQKLRNGSTLSKESTWKVSSSAMTSGISVTLKKSSDESKGSNHGAVHKLSIQKYDASKIEKAQPSEIEEKHELNFKSPENNCLPVRQLETANAPVTIDSPKSDEHSKKILLATSHSKLMAASKKKVDQKSSSIERKTSNAHFGTHPVISTKKRNLTVIRSLHEHKQFKNEQKSSRNLNNPSNPSQKVLENDVKSSQSSIKRVDKTTNSSKLINSCSDKSRKHNVTHKTHKPSSSEQITSEPMVCDPSVSNKAVRCNELKDLFEAHPTRQETGDCSRYIEPTPGVCYQSSNNALEGKVELKQKESSKCINTLSLKQNLSNEESSEPENPNECSLLKNKHKSSVDPILENSETVLNDIISVCETEESVRLRYDRDKTESVHSIELDRKSEEEFSSDKVSKGTKPADGALEEHRENELKKIIECERSNSLKNKPPCGDLPLNLSDVLCSADVTKTVENDIQINSVTNKEHQSNENVFEIQQQSNDLHRNSHCENYLLSFPECSQLEGNSDSLKGEESNAYTQNTGVDTNNISRSQSNDDPGKCKNPILDLDNMHHDDGDTEHDTDLVLQHIVAAVSQICVQPGTDALQGAYDAVQMLEKDQETSTAINGKLPGTSDGNVSNAGNTIKPPNMMVGAYDAVQMMKKDQESSTAVNRELSGTSDGNVSNARNTIKPPNMMVGAYDAVQMMKKDQESSTTVNRELSGTSDGNVSNAGNTIEPPNMMVSDTAFIAAKNTCMTTDDNEITQNIEDMINDIETITHQTQNSVNTEYISPETCYVLNQTAQKTAHVSGSTVQTAGKTDVVFAAIGNVEERADEKGDNVAQTAEHIAQQAHCNTENIALNADDIVNGIQHPAKQIDDSSPDAEKLGSSINKHTKEVADFSEDECKDVCLKVQNIQVDQQTEQVNQKIIDQSISTTLLHLRTNMLADVQQVDETADGVKLPYEHKLHTNDAVTVFEIEKDNNPSFDSISRQDIDACEPGERGNDSDSQVTIRQTEKKYAESNQMDSDELSIATDRMAEDCGAGLVEENEGEHLVIVTMETEEISTEEQTAHSLRSENYVDTTVSNVFSHEMEPTVGIVKVKSVFENMTCRSVDKHKNDSNVLDSIQMERINSNNSIDSEKKNVLTAQVAPCVQQVSQSSELVALPTQQQQLHANTEQEIVDTNWNALAEKQIDLSAEQLYLSTDVVDLAPEQVVVSTEQVELAMKQQLIVTSEGVPVDLDMSVGSIELTTEQSDMAPEQVVSVDKCHEHSSGNSMRQGDEHTIVQNETAFDSQANTFNTSNNKDMVSDSEKPHFAEDSASYVVIATENTVNQQPENLDWFTSSISMSDNSTEKVETNGTIKGTVSAEDCSVLNEDLDSKLPPCEDSQPVQMKAVDNNTIETSPDHSQGLVQVPLGDHFEQTNQEATHSMVLTNSFKDREMEEGEEGTVQPAFTSDEGSEKDVLKCRNGDSGEVSSHLDSVDSKDNHMNAIQLQSGIPFCIPHCVSSQSDEKQVMENVAIKDSKSTNMIPNSFREEYVKSLEDCSDNLIISEQQDSGESALDCRVLSVLVNDSICSDHELASSETLDLTLKTLDSQTENYVVDDENVTNCQSGVIADGEPMSQCIDEHPADNTSSQAEGCYIYSSDLEISCTTEVLYNAENTVTEDGIPELDIYMENRIMDLSVKSKPSDHLEGPESEQHSKTDSENSSASDKTSEDLVMTQPPANQIEIMQTTANQQGNIIQIPADEIELIQTSAIPISFGDATLPSTCNHIENISDGILYNNEVDIVTEPEKSPKSKVFISNAQVLSMEKRSTSNYDSDSTFIYSEGENSDFDRLYICEDKNSNNSASETVCSENKKSKEPHASSEDRERVNSEFFLESQQNKESGTLHQVTSVVCDKKTRKRKCVKKRKNSNKETESDGAISITTNEKSSQNVERRKRKCNRKSPGIQKKKRLVSGTNETLENFEIAFDGSENEKIQSKTVVDENVVLVSDDSDNKKIFSNSSDEKKMPMDCSDDKQSIAMEKIPDDKMFTEIEPEQNNVSIEARSVCKQSVVTRRRSRGRNQRTVSKRQQKLNKNSNQKANADQTADSDELPTIFPPKRRRSMMRPRLIHGMSGFTDNTRIMQEFPQHNWLQNKYKSDSSPKGGDFNELPSQLDEELIDRNKPELMTSSVSLPQLEKSREQNSRDTSETVCVEELMELGPPELERVGDAKTESPLECNNGVTDLSEGSVLDGKVDLIPDITTCEGETSAVQAETCQHEKEVSLTDHQHDPAQKTEGNDTQKLTRKSSTDNVDEQKVYEESTKEVTNTSKGDSSQPLNLSTKRMDGISANFKSNPNPPIQKVHPQVQKPVATVLASVLVPDQDDLIVQTKEVIKNIQGQMPAETNAINSVQSDATKVTGVISSEEALLTIPDVDLSVPKGQNSQTTLALTSPSSCTSQQSPAMVNGNNSQHKSNVVVIQSRLPPIPCLIPIRTGTGQISQDSDNTKMSVGNTIQDNLGKGMQIQVDENSGEIPRVIDFSNMGQQIPSSSNSDLLTENSANGSNKRKFSAPNENEPPSKVTCNVVKKITERCDEPLSLIVSTEDKIVSGSAQVKNVAEEKNIVQETNIAQDHSDGKEKKEENIISIMSNAISERIGRLKTDILENEEYENHLQQLKHLSDLTAKKEKEYEEILKMRQEKLEELRQIELKKSCQYKIPSAQFISTDTNESSKMNDSSLQIHKNVEKIKETDVMDLSLQISTDHLKKKNTIQSSKLSDIDKRSMHVSGSTSNQSRVKIITESSSGMDGENADLKMEISVSSHGKQKPKPAHNHFESPIRILRKIDQSMLTIPFFKKFSTPSHKNEPLFEPPSVLSRTKKKGTLKKAHCQPPFQTAGSLIVPLPSYFHQQIKPHGKDADRLMIEPPSPSKGNKGMVSKPIQQKPYMFPSENSTSAIRQERKLSDGIGEPSHHHSGHFDPGVPPQLMAVNTSVAMNAAHVNLSPSIGSPILTRANSTPREVIDLSKSPEPVIIQSEDTETVIQKELNAAIANRYKTDLCATSQSGQKFLIPYQNVPQFEPQQSSSLQRSCIAERQNPQNLSSGMLPRTHIAFNKMFEQKALNKFRDIAPRPNQSPVSSHTPRNTVAEHNSVREALLNTNPQFVRAIHQKLFRPDVPSNETRRTGQVYGPHMIGRQHPQAPNSDEFVQGQQWRQKMPPLQQFRPSGQVMQHQYQQNILQQQQHFQQQKQQHLQQQHSQQQQQFQQQEAQNIQQHHQQQQQILRGQKINSNIPTTVPSQVSFNLSTQNPHRAQTVQLIGAGAVPLDTHPIKGTGQQLSPIPTSVSQQQNTGVVQSGEMLAPPLGRKVSPAGYITSQGESTVFLRHPMFHDHKVGLHPKGQVPRPMFPPSTMAMQVQVNSQQKMVIQDSQQHSQQALQPQMHPAYRSQATHPGMHKVPISPTQYMQSMPHRGPRFIVPNTVPHMQQGGNNCEMPHSGAPQPGQVVLMQASNLDGQLHPPQPSNPMMQEMGTYGPNPQGRPECSPIHISMECSEQQQSPSRRLITGINHGSYHTMVAHPGGSRVPVVPSRSPNMQNQHMMAQVQYTGSSMQEYPLQNMQSSPSSQQAAPTKVSQVNSESPTVTKEPNPTPPEQTRTQTDTRTSPLEHSPPIIQMVRSNCIVCNKVASYLCSSCKNIWYCSTECQLNHWVSHSHHCKPNIT
ncbi:hypothetical protein ScPMuIL_006545 [Solemya velum]